MSKLSNWRETRNPKYQVCSADDFRGDPSVPDGIKASYMEYIQKTNVLKLDRNDKGYYKFDWMEDDEQAKFRYQPTYKDPYGWGVMRGPIFKKDDTAQAQQEQGQQKLETKTEAKSDFKVNSPKGEDSLARIADAVEIIAKVVAEKNIETADKMLKKKEEVQEPE